MRLRVVWHPAALSTFNRLPLHTATLVDRAVLRFAERGEGTARWDAPYYRLIAGFHDVLFTMDERAFEMNVLHIYRARR